MSKRLLVVDDEAEIRRMLRQFLEILGHEVSEAGGAREAEEALRARAFDLVITDVCMPSGSGLDVLRTAKALAPARPVVLITGFADPTDGTADGYLQKPFDLDELERTLADLLG